MPPLETFDLKEVAVLWPAEGADHRGRLLRGEPVEVKVRWTPKREDILDTNGQRISITVMVGIDREVEVDSWMWLGSLDEWYASGSAGQSLSGGNQLMQVVRVDWADDDKGRERRYSVALRRWKDELPALA